MIRAATIEDIRALPCNEEALLRIHGAAEMYGADRPFCRFWVDGNGGALMVSEGVATLCPADSLEEWSLFLTMSPDVHTVRTTAAAARRLASVWQCKAESGHVMCTDSVTVSGAAADVPPAALYPLISDVFGTAIPSFDAWYADVHHRWRRGGFCSRAVCEEGRVVSCAMTVAQCEEAVLIGAVATHPAARGRGLASACVTALTDWYLQKGKRVYISPKNDKAETLYRHLGFTVCGEWGKVEKD